MYGSHSTDKHACSTFCPSSGGNIVLWMQPVLCWLSLLAIGYLALAVEFVVLALQKGVHDKW